MKSILGDQGAASRDDAIFSGESFSHVRKSPWYRIVVASTPWVSEDALSRDALSRYSIALKSRRMQPILHQIKFTPTELAILNSS